MGRRGPRWHFTGLGCRLWCLIQLLVTASPVSAQPGTEFISIDCGAPPGPDYQDDAGLTWQPDGDTVLPNLAATGAGSVQVASAAGLVRPMTTLRYFPPESTPVKSCFVLPVTAGNLYLVRAGFFYGNYDGLGSPSIQFQIALESTVWQDVALNGSSTRPLYIEAVTPSLESSEINVCLIRTQATSTPFINTLELRPLDGFMYQSAQPASNNDFSRNVNFYLAQRVNFGERDKTLRYPDDQFDRIWPSYLDIYPELNTVVQNISTSRPIIDDLTRDEPPSAVMQTAITASEFSYSYPKGMAPGEYSMYMFYAELEELRPSQSRVFEVFPTYYDAGAHDDVNLSSLRPPFSTLQFGNTARTLGNASVTTRLSRNNTSDKGPILNADELYHVVDYENGTASSDVLNLHRLKELFGIPQWTGDPCMPVPWDELQCTNRTVTSLNLSRKNLSVPVPADTITGLGSFTSIDLSSNAFSGPFPNFSALSSLQALNISNNRLTGAFPDWVSELKSLSVLDVSNNNLTGSFPDTLFNTLGNNFRYSGNLLLTCSGAACPYAPPPGLSPPSLASSRKAPAPSSSSALIGAIIGGIAGAGLLILVVTGIIVCCCKRQKMNKRVPPTGLGDGAVSSEPVSPEPMKLPVRPGKAQPYTLQSLKEATNNFSKQISVGGFGSVFFGTLPDNQQIAVKKLLGSSQQSLRGFTTEIDFLSTVHHKNLVPLLGYCRESSALFLLYEYMAGGDLRRRLYGPNATSDPLSWKARLSIAVDAARGIEYLHHGCKPSIIHRGLTSSSILLTSKLDAKVSDFGLSKLIGDGKSQLTTTLLGDTEYLDPEYSETRVLTEKSDVYSFGIILLEIMCGQPPVPPEGARLASNQGPLADRVQSAMSGGSLGRIMDPFMSGRYSSESASKFAEVAMSCLRASGSRRPTASQIITGLLQASEIENQVSEANRYSAAPVGHSRQSRARLPLPEYPSSTSNTGYLAEDMPSQIFHASEQPAPR